MLRMPDLGVLIPTLNEACMIGGCLDRLAAHAAVLIVDGGSADATVQVARAHANRPPVVVVAGGRHRQLDYGLRQLDCAWVLVLSADARLRPGALERVAEHCRHLPGPAACLRLHPSDAHAWHRVRARWSALRSRWSAVAYTDQAPLFHRATALAVGSFRDHGTYDTADLARRLRRHGPFTVLPESVVVSCREYRTSFWATTLTHQRHRWQHWRGHEPKHQGAASADTPPRVDRSDS